MISRFKKLLSPLIPESAVSTVSVILTITVWGFLPLTAMIDLVVFLVLC